MPETPADEMPTPTLKRWPPKWPSWLSVSVVISMVALMISGTNAYFTLFDKHDDIEAVWGADPLPFLDRTGKTLSLKGPFSITLFNMGTRSAAVTNVRASLFTPGLDVGKIFNSGRSVSGCVVSTWPIHLSPVNVILKPGEASNLQLVPTFPDFPIDEFFIEAVERDQIRMCLNFEIVTPSGWVEKDVTKGDFNPYDWVQSVLPIEDFTIAARVSRTEITSGSASRPIVLYKH